MNGRQATFLDITRTIAAQSVLVGHIYMTLIGELPVMLGNFGVLLFFVLSGFLICYTVLETSTVGVQAALIGIPVITVAADGYPPYTALGLAVDVPSLACADEALLRARKPDLSRLGAQEPDIATERVTRVIYNLLG